VITADNNPDLSASRETPTGVSVPTTVEVRVEQVKARSTQMKTVRTGCTNVMLNRSPVWFVHS